MTPTLEHDLRGCLGPIRDQGDRPTCLAHAASAAHEVARESSGWLSTEYLYYFGKTSIPGVVSALLKHGQPLDADCPYQPQDPEAAWTPSASLTVYRRKSSKDTVSAERVSELIRAGRAVVLGLCVTADFFNPAAPWILSPKGPRRGFHAVTGVGVGRFNGSRVFLIRNSWGSDWGDSGYGWIGDDYVAKHVKDILVLGEEAVSP